MASGWRKLIWPLVVVLAVGIFADRRAEAWPKPYTANAPVEYGRFPQDSAIPNQYLEAVIYNVGNVGLGPLGPLGIPPHSCPNHKLCWQWTVDNLRAWIEKVDPDVLLLQETMGMGQVFGSENFGPLVSTDTYEGECLEHVCVLWRKGLVSLGLEGCGGYETPNGTLLSCKVESQGQFLQLISVYLPANHFLLPDNGQRLKERAFLSDVLFRGRENVVDTNYPTIMGGDFNSNKNLLKDGSDFPYPKNYFTLFGQHVEGYGLFGKEGPYFPPAHNFFGVYEQGRPLPLATQFAFAHRSPFDHVFANFGFPLHWPLSPTCRGYACTEGQGGLPGLREIRKGQDGTDHEAIFVRLGWNSPDPSNAPH